jgi:DNA-binding SARP family transcriptional activator
VQASLQVHISNARKALAAAGSALEIVTRAPGYLTVGDDVSIDVVEIERLLRRAEREAAHEQTVRAVATLDEAMALRHGSPLADLVDEPFAGPAIARIEEIATRVVELRAALRLDLGAHASVLSELEECVGNNPLHEPFWVLLMTALYRSGRQADALKAYQRCRDVLLDSLGIDPGSELQELESAILRQDPALARSAGEAGTSALDLTRTVRRAQARTAALVVADGTTYTLLPGTSTIGRRADNAVRLDDPDVSRTHAAVITDTSGSRIEDLGSTNGTFVNGEPVASRSLTDGDQIVIGTIELTFRDGLPGL